MKPTALPKILHLNYYLRLSPNPVYTTQEMCAYKGVEARNPITPGQVWDVATAFPKADIAAITAVFARLKAMQNIQTGARHAFTHNTTHTSATLSRLKMMALTTLTME